MKYILRTIAALAALICVAALIGWMLPVGHVATRTITLRAAPETVFDLIRNVEGYPTWRPDVTQVDLLETGDAIVRFREHSGTGPLVMEMIEATRPTRIVSRIADPDQPFGGTWTFEIAGAGNEARSPSPNAARSTTRSSVSWRDSSSAMTPR